jgi:PRC-barrel domain
VLNVEHIEEWRGQDVLDCDGEQIGKLEEVFYDAGSGEPVLLAVKKGLLGGGVRLIPLAGASVGHDYVRVAYGNEDTEQAEGSSIPGTLAREETDRIAAIYGLDLAEDIELESASVTAERRVQADEAHRRADELAGEAQRKDAEREDAQRREEGAAAEADLATGRAEVARQAAAEARQAANAAEPTSRSGE